MRTRFPYFGLVGCLTLAIACATCCPEGSATGHMATHGAGHAQLDTPELDSSWRYTRYGWQDSSEWIRTPAEISPRGIDQINPVLISLDILLAAAAAMIWASDECQVARLFGRQNDPKLSSDETDIDNVIT